MNQQPHTSQRTIIHLDLDAFFCAVEEQRDPTLARQPFAVGGHPERRGVVASCSYAARQFGVHSAMPMAHAVRLCPPLLVVPPDFAAYRAASQAVMELLHNVSALVEQISIDEAFLDVSELDTSGAALAADLQARIRRELELSCSIGVASNKLVAKVATDVGKTAARTGKSPQAICVVPAGQEAAFLAPLPVAALWGVGPKTETRLAALGLYTIGDLAAWPAADLERRFGKHGADLARRAHGIDQRPIVTSHVRKSFSHETTFATDIRDVAVLRQTIRTQARAIAQQLQQRGTSGTTIKIKLRWPDFTTPTRQTTLAHPTDQEGEIAEAALRLFEQLWDAQQPVRLLGIGVGGLSEALRQMSLWDVPAMQANHERERQVQAVLDALRARFGEASVKRGSDLEPRGDETTKR